MSEKRHPEYQYLDLCQDILDNGADKELFFDQVILDEYKKKVREFESMNEKVQGVLKKCEHIVERYEEDKNRDEQKQIPKETDGLK